MNAFPESLKTMTIEQLRTLFDYIDARADDLVCQLGDIQKEVKRRDPRPHGGAADGFWSAHFE